MIRLSKKKHIILETEIICDECGKVLEFVPVTVEFSYNHKNDGIVAHFCNNECLILYMKNEQKKTEKIVDERFIYGEQKKGKKK
jgi:hypothetical protein